MRQCSPSRHGQSNGPDTGGCCRPQRAARPGLVPLHHHRIAPAQRAPASGPGLTRGGDTSPPETLRRVGAQGFSPPAADCTWSSATGRTLHACSTSASGRRPTWACAARRSRSTSRRALASIDIYDLCRSQDGNRTSHSSCACQTPSHRNRVDTMLSTDVTYRIDENKGG